MAEVDSSKAPSLVEQDYYLEKKEEKPLMAAKAVEDAEVATDAAKVTVEKTEEKPSEEVAPASEEDAGESKESSGPVDEASAEDNTNSSEPENSVDQEADEAPEIKLETAPADFRFPTTNQTRHCFTRYIEYHRCVAAKGEGATECDKFAKYYRSLCPGEWIDRWNEQRENGTFPGPL
ncbi:hypothetical protein ACS0TY_024264 [Phlomoides rotata]